jgi:hypothetical protein
VPGPRDPAHGSVRRGRWWLPAVVAGSLVVGSLASAVVAAILYANGEESITSLSPRALVWLTLAMGALFGLILTFVIVSDSSVTPGKPDAPPGKPIPKRHHRRSSQAAGVPDSGDEILAIQLTPDQWRTVADRLRRRRVPTLIRRVAMLPVLVLGTAVTIVLAGGDWLAVLPDSFVYTAGPWIGLLVGVWWLATQLSDLRAVWRGPMLLVRGVVGNVDEAPLVPSPDPEELPADLAATASGIEHASVVVAVPRTQLLHPDGYLEDAPPSVYRGVYTSDVPTDGTPRKLRLHCSRRTAKRLHHGDRVALLCFGDKRVVARLRDLLDHGTEAERSVSPN